MVFRPDAQPAKPQQEKLNVSAEQYRDNAARLTSLLDFMRAGGNWDDLDPATKDGHRDTLQTLKRVQSTAEFAQLSLAQTAQALITRFESKALLAEQNTAVNRPIDELPEVRVAEKLRVDQPRADGEIVRLPQLGNTDWEVVRIDVSNRKYVIANPQDRRSVSDIVSDVRSNRSRNGAPVGYEVTWEELEQLAERRTA